MMSRGRRAFNAGAGEDIFLGITKKEWWRRRESNPRLSSKINNLLMLHTAYSPHSAHVAIE
jgi:hypothetical protein